MPPALSSGVLQFNVQTDRNGPDTDAFDRLANDPKLLARLVKCWWARKPVHTAGSGAQQL
jgi:hypothetical protein